MRVLRSAPSAAPVGGLFGSGVRPLVRERPSSSMTASSPSPGMNCIT